MTLSVDVASWNTNLWNFSRIANTAVDFVMTMDTYGSNFTQWQHDFQFAVQNIPPNKLGIGLESTHPDGRPWTNTELQERFQMIAEYNIQQLDIWDLPLSDSMLSYLQTFMNS
eukprot:TRINITY_DN2453_c0_g2_i1.p2 TRINITY_DN2453_c0_g2~~TRINITY_DN2453_c0_g2_i1.p2  ORF type:complete len:113 (-),score=25.43 TRINITY_DN2453_c0_g2_i1:344-682(-)